MSGDGREAVRSERGSDFAHIVYTLLVVEKPMTFEEVAFALGMSYAILHSRIIARSAFSADEIRSLLRLLPDQHLASYLLDGTKIVAADRETVDSDQSVFVNASIQRGATKVVVDAAEILELVDASLAGGRSTIEASAWS